jgi:hypothetical protein
MYDPEIIRIIDQAWESLSKLPGVHAVGIGSKVVAGTRTDEPAIVVFVVRKKSLDQLEADELVPSTMEGVKTDVVEMKMPHLFRGVPTIEAIVAPLPAGTGSGGIITLSTNRSPTVAGWVVVVSVLLTAPTGPPQHIFTSFYTNGKQTISQVAFGLAIRFSINLPGFSVMHTPETGIITVTARPGFAALVSCYARALDVTRYADEYLRGGICIQEGRNFDVGTLGCIATTAPTPKDPKGKIVALTNHHVVSNPRVTLTNLRASLNSVLATLTMSVSDGEPVLPQSLVAVVFFQQKDTLAVALHVTKPGETLADVTAGIIVAINNAPIPGVSALLDKGAVKVTGFNGSDMDCFTSGPPDSSLAPLLSFAIEKPLSRTSVLTFRGQVPNEDYGIFLDINPGGTRPTFGAFVNPASGANLSSIAESVAESINSVTASINKGLAPADRLKVHAERSGAQITITDAQEIECTIRGDIRVGQPTNNFGSPCSRCCSHQIGRVIDARLDVDAAIIQLDPGLRYKPHIQELGPVDGTLAATRNLLVQKRGFISGVTSGQVRVVGASGLILKSGFKRFYKNAMFIESTTTGPGGAVLPFILEGDSGSAVVSTGVGSRKIVGLLFAGTDDTMAIAAPIDQLVDAFPDLKLSFALAPGQDPNAVQTVPTPAIAFKAIDTEEAAESGRMGTASDGFGWSSLGGRLREAEREIGATAVGREYASVIQTHFAEVQTLVNNNRRVGTVWQRSGGPEIMNRMLEIIYARDQRLPTEINGKPFADCLARIQQVLMRYASPAFAKDLSRCAPQIAKWSGMTYTELLSAFQNSDME